MQPKSRLQTSHSPFIQTRASKAFGTNVSQAIGISSIKPALMCSLRENSLAGTQVMLSITCVPQLKFQTLFPSSDFQEEVHVMISLIEENGHVIIKHRQFLVCVLLSLPRSVLQCTPLRLPCSWFAHCCPIWEDHS